MDGINVSRLILDGGLGTTVEELDKDATHHPLWSGKLLKDNPKLLFDTHVRFLEAGADIIETATYQSSLATFARAGYAKEEAKAAMLSAVTMAEDAIRYFEQSSGTRRRPLMALSLGPYGAQITQEYGGIYPPPYGPPVDSTSFETQDASFTPAPEELSAELALSEWHLDRLQIFADSPSHWGLISFIAFETIPLLREGRAIRRAMTRLREVVLARGLPWHPWWISFVYPRGRFPEAKVGGGPIAPRDIARGIFGPTDQPLGNVSIPDGIGINCTNLRFLYDIALGYAAGVEDVSDQTIKPTLVLYPDGGFEYDAQKKVWKGPGEAGQSIDNSVEPGQSWGRSLAELGELCCRTQRHGSPVCRP